MYCSVLGGVSCCPSRFCRWRGCCWELEAPLQNETTIATYRLGTILGEGTILHGLLVIMSKAGSAIFDNLPIIFAIGVAIGMAKAEKEVAALSAAIAFFVMNVSISAVLEVTGKILPDGSISPDVLEGTLPACAEYRHFKWVCLGELSWVWG